MTRKVIYLRADKNSKIKYNYHYELMKQIYRLIEIHDIDKCRCLHDKGYTKGNKKYKLFTFGLLFSNAKFTRDKIDLSKGSEFQLVISGKKEIISMILRGAMKTEGILIDNTLYKINRVEDSRTVKFSNIMLYKAINPVIETTMNDDKEVVYLNIYQQKFYENMAYNLMNKYELIYGKPYDDELYFDIHEPLETKDKVIHLDGGKKGALTGQTFRIWIEATPKMQKIAYYCGIGQNNAQGMGFLIDVPVKEGEVV